MGTPLLAATATWTNTGNGAVGSWTGSGNWNADYPGQSAAGDNAFLTNIVNGSVYKANVDASPAYSIGQLTIRNAGSGGEAWVIVTNTALTNTSTTTIGAGGRLKVDAGGQLFGGNVMNIDSPVAGGAEGFTVANGGVWSNTANTVNIVVGNNTSFNQMSIRSGGKVYSGGNASAARNFIGYSSGAASNTVVVTDSGSLWMMTYDLALGYTAGSGNTLIVSNGGTVVHTGAAYYNGLYSSNSLTLVTGSGSLFSNTVGSLYVGYNSASNQLAVRNGGTFSAGSGNFYLGGNNSATWPSNSVGNSIVVSDPGSLLTVGGTFYVGYKGGKGHNVTVSNGAQLAVSTTTYVGTYTTNDSILVTGSGSLWTNTTGGTLYVGNSGSEATLTTSEGGRLRSGSVRLGGGASSTSNRLVVTNGGLLNTASGYIGDVSSGNLAWVGGYDPITGDPSLWSVGALLMGNTAGSVSNRLVVDQGGVVTNIGGATGLAVGYVSGANNNTAVITNGGKIYIQTTGIVVGKGTASGNRLIVDGGSVFNAGGALYIAQGSTVGGTNNAVSVVANGLLDMGTFSVLIGSAAGFAPGISNSLTVTTGGVVTNVGRNTFNLTVGACTNANYNSLTVTNGGQFHMKAGAVSVGAWTSIVGGNSNTLTLGDGLIGSDADSYIGTVSTGNVVTIMGTGAWNGSNKVLYVGYGAAGNNSLKVDGGQVAYFKGLVVGSDATAVGNSARVTAGGLLEANALTTGAGNLITNTGGIYQFITNSPGITNNGYGNITLNNGVIAFRNVRNVDVNDNVTGNLTNVAFSGNNAFRLNNSTNSTIVPQTYVFSAGAAPAYAGLELVNGKTSYTNGDVTINTGGWLTFSNTTAIMWGMVTNSGTMTITNSTVTFMQNLRLGEGCTLNQNSNSTVTVNGSMSLPSSATLNLSGVAGPSDQVVLFQATGGITGTAANWAVSPYTHRVAVSSDGLRLMLLPTRRGFIFIVE